MDQLELQAEPRAVTGKHVRKLRSEGKIPAVIYGRHTNPVHIQVPERELLLALNEAGEATLLSLSVEGEDAPRTVLVRDQQRDVLTQRPIHADFYEVIMTEKLRTAIRLVLEGTAPILEEAEGVLIQPLEEIEVECLPSDLVPHITVDVSSLTDFDAAIFLKDLTPPPGIEILTDLDEMVVKASPIAAAPAEEEEEEVAPVAADEVEVVRRPRREEEEGAEAAEAE